VVLAAAGLSYPDAIRCVCWGGILGMG
jgi:hypothetical protein